MDFYTVNSKALAEVWTVFLYSSERILPRPEEHFQTFRASLRDLEDAGVLQWLNGSPQEMAQLNEYGKEFQHCHLGRRGTVHSPISRRVIEDKTYQKRPPKFTPEMEVDYQNYKEAARSSSNMQSQYQKILKTYGGFQRMTEDQHREVLELYSGPFDEQLKWVERSPMAIACHLSVFPRNHCHYP